MDEESPNIEPSTEGEPMEQDDVEMVTEVPASVDARTKQERTSNRDDSEKKVYKRREAANKLKTMPLFEFMELPYEKQIEAKAADVKNIVDRMYKLLAPCYKSFGYEVDDEMLDRGSEIYDVEKLQECESSNRSVIRFTFIRGMDVDTGDIVLGVEADGDLVRSASTVKYKYPNHVLNLVQVLEKFEPTCDAVMWNTLNVMTNSARQLSLLVFLKCSEGEEAEAESFAKELTDFFTTGEGSECSITSLYVKTNDSLSLLMGPDHIDATVADLKIQLATSQDMWSNIQGAEALCDAVKDLLTPRKNTTVLELGCGSGLIGLHLSKFVEEVLSVDEDSVVKMVKKSAELNKITNCQYFAGPPHVLLNDIVDKIKTDDVCAVMNVKTRQASIIQELRRIKSLSRVLLLTDLHLMEKMVFNFCKPDGKEQPLFPARFYPVDCMPSTKSYVLLVLLERMADDVDVDAMMMKGDLKILDCVASDDDDDEPVTIVQEQDKVEQKYKSEMGAVWDRYILSVDGIPTGEENVLKRGLTELLGNDTHKIRPRLRTDTVIYVHFRYLQDAKDAMAALDNKSLEGNTVTVKVCQTPNDKTSLEEEIDDSPAVKRLKNTSAVEFMELPYETQIAAKMDNVRDVLDRMFRHLAPNYTSYGFDVDDALVDYGSQFFDVEEIKQCPPIEDSVIRFTFIRGKDVDTGDIVLGVDADRELVRSASTVKYKYPDHVLNLVKVLEKSAPTCNTTMWNKLYVCTNGARELLLLLFLRCRVGEEEEKNNFVKELKELLTTGEGSGCGVVSVHIKTNDTLSLLMGPDHIDATVADLKIQLATARDMWSNIQGAEALCTTVKDLLAPKKNTTVLELGCGSGLIGLHLSKLAGQVLSVDQKAAVEVAKRNAELNDVTNCKYFEGLAHRLIPSIAKEIKHDDVCAVMNVVGHQAKMIEELRKIESLNRVLLMTEVFALEKVVPNFCKPDKKMGRPLFPVRAVPVDCLPSMRGYVLLILLEHVKDIVEPVNIGPKITIMQNGDDESLQSSRDRRHKKDGERSSRRRSGDRDRRCDDYGKRRREDDSGRRKHDEDRDKHKRDDDSSRKRRDDDRKRDDGSRRRRDDDRDKQRRDDSSRKRHDDERDRQKRDETRDRPRRGDDPGRRRDRHKRDDSRGRSKREDDRDKPKKDRTDGTHCVIREVERDIRRREVRKDISPQETLSNRLKQVIADVITGVLPQSSRDVDKPSRHSSMDKDDKDPWW